MQASQSSDLNLEVATNVEKHYFNEANANRVKRELQELYNAEQPEVLLDTAYYTSTALIVPIRCRTDGLPIHFHLRLDFDYPFNHPQLLLADRNSLAGQCRDLLSLLMAPDEKWEPSMSLTQFLPKLRSLARTIQDNKQQLMGQYHEFENYGIDELKQHGLTFYKAKEKHRKLLVNHRVDKLLAFGKFVVLKFGYLEKNLRLQFWQPIRCIHKVLSDVDKNELSLVFENNNKERTLKLLEVENIEEVLQRLNPTQMLERRIELAEQNGSVDEALLKDYSDLIGLLSAKEECKEQVAELVRKLSEASARLYKP